MVLGVGYVGNKGTRVPLTVNINQPNAGPGIPQSRRPYTQYGNISYLFSGESSIYHSLAPQLEKRLGESISFLANYTFSKVIDNGVQDISSVQNAHNLRAEMGLSNIDSPQRFNGGFVYQLPIRKGRPHLSSTSGTGQAFLGGWQFSGIISVLSGVPFNTAVSSDIANTGATGQRPNRVGSGRLSNPSLVQWFDVTAFVAPAPFSFGSGGRNLLLGPGLANADLSLYQGIQRIQIPRPAHRAVPQQVFQCVELAAFPAAQIQFAPKYLF